MATKQPEQTAPSDLPNAEYVGWAECTTGLCNETVAVYKTPCQIETDYYRYHSHCSECGEYHHHIYDFYEYGATATGYDPGSPDDA